MGGLSGGNRTPDPQLRRLLLYPTELLALHPPLLRTGATDRGGRIRTGDLLLPKQARYRATLRPVSPQS